MAAPYSQDLRARVLGAYERGMQTKEIAENFDVCPAWARRVKQRRRDNGELTHRPMGGKRFQKIDRAALAELVKARPDATLEELRKGLGVDCALSAVCTALKKLGMSFTFAAVTTATSGVPSASVRMWCLLPGLPRSVGLGPVASPPRPRGGRRSRPRPGTSRAARRC